MLIIYTARSYIGSLPCRKPGESNPLSRKIELEVISRLAACENRSCMRRSFGNYIFARWMLLYRATMELIRDGRVQLISGDRPRTEWLAHTRLTLRARDYNCALVWYAHRKERKYSDMYVSFCRRIISLSAKASIQHKTKIFARACRKKNITANIFDARLKDWSFFKIE